MDLVRIFVVIALWAGFASVSRAADTSSCISACEAPAITCSDNNRRQKYACMRGVRASCQGLPYEQLLACVNAANEACVDAHNPAIAACDDTFKGCHRACNGNQPVTRGYWCRTEVDLTGDVTRKTGYCDLEQGKEALEACLKRFEVPAPSGSTVMMECSPL